MVMMRKGQTALEYLMTYGWAILIVIVVVAALYSLGLTKPCRWVGTQISGFGEVRISNIKFNSTGHLTLYLQRQKLGDINVTAIQINSTNNGNGYTSYSPPVTLISGGPAKSFVAGPTSGGTTTAGDCYALDVKIIYDDISVSPPVRHETVGKITGTIEAA